MKTVLRSLMIVPLVMALSCGGAGDHGAEEAEAFQAAEIWLQLIDQEMYEESWNEAASIFKSAVTAEQWQQQVKAARAVFGEFGARELKGTEYMSSMPGAPDGDYVVIQFNALFANKEAAVETVTPMKDPDGVWRVAGYYIK
jgi:hypothetical protein